MSGPDSLGDHDEASRKRKSKNLYVGKFPPSLTSPHPPMLMDLSLFSQENGGKRHPQTCTRQTIQSRRMGRRVLAPGVWAGQGPPARSCLNNQHGCSPQPELGPAGHRTLACPGRSHRAVEWPQQGLWDPCPDCQSYFLLLCLQSLV